MLLSTRASPQSTGHRYAYTPWHLFSLHKCMQINMCLCISSPVHLTTICYQCEVTMFCTQHAIPVSHLGVIMPFPLMHPPHAPPHSHPSPSHPSPLTPPTHVPPYSPPTPTPTLTQADKLHSECSEVRRQLQHQEQDTERAKQEGFIETERVRVYTYVRTLVSTLCTTRTASVHRNADQG